MREEPTTPPAPAITPRASAAYLCARWAFQFLGALLFRIRVTGRENVPAGNYAVVANHLSWIDPFLLVMYLPANPRLYFVGAQQAVNRGWKDWIVRHFDMMIPFEKGAAWVGREVLEKPKRVLAAGAVLGIFPEGGLGPAEGDVMPLQRGIGHILLASGRPVLPVAISGVQELYLRKAIAVTIGKSFSVAAAVEGLGHHAAVDLAVQRVDEAIRAILPRYVEPKPAFKVMRFLTRLLDLGQRQT